MSVQSSAPLELGISPCPNDTFIFHALLHGLVSAPCPLQAHLADVEELNTLAQQGTLAVSKVSVGVLPSIVDKYVVLSAGAALGFGCGPLVVARQFLTEQDCQKASVAVPGLRTTANLLLNVHGGFQGERKVMLFSDVMPCVERGETDLCVIIHEGRFTYQEHGLVKILDLGEWWEKTFALPLPLGAIVARRDLPKEQILALQTAIANSLLYAREHPQTSRPYIRQHAQELSDAVISAHIQTFVNDYSLNLGSTGREAIMRLLSWTDSDSVSYFAET